MRRKQRMSAVEQKWVAAILLIDFIMAATGGAFFLF